MKNCISSRIDYVSYSKSVEKVIDELLYHRDGRKILLIDTGKEFYVFENEDIATVPIYIQDMLVKSFEYLYTPSTQTTRLLLDISFPRSNL